MGTPVRYNKRTMSIILTVVFFLLLLLVAAVRPQYSLYSTSELTRRAQKSAHFKKELERQRLLPTIYAILSVKTSLLLLIVVCLSIVTFGWFAGVALSVLVAVSYGSLANSRLVARMANRWYASIEPHTLARISKYPALFNLLKYTPFYPPDHYRRFDSKEELAELIAQDTEALSDGERKLLSSTLLFANKTVQETMTPRAVIDSIAKHEFLGPLVLSELHNLGHSRLPVIDGDLDHVVGVLHIRDLLSLDVKRSTTVERAMEKKVYYLHQEDSLEHALSAFLRVRHHLFIVINSQRETVGLITLEDVIEALIGRRIVDEDDIHEDLQAVARRRAIHTNDTEDGVDL